VISSLGVHVLETVLAVTLDDRGI